MKLLCILLPLSLIAVAVGCATNKSAQRTDAPDGLYRWEHHASAGYVIQGVNSDFIPRVSEITTFRPQRFVVAPYHPSTEVTEFSVEISGPAPEELQDDWHDIVIIMNHKLYSGIAKRTDSFGDIVVTTDTRKQADAIVSMLRSRYFVSP